MGVLWYKVWYDLWRNKMRTALAVLSIAAGVFAVGAMFGMSDLLVTNLDKNHQSVAPPHLTVYLGDLVDRDTLLNLSRVSGVEDVDPFNEVGIRYKLHEGDDWRPGALHMRGDFTQQKYELVQLMDGRWPRKGEIGIERMAASFLGADIGDQVIVKIGDSERSYPITGRIRHPFVPPPQFQDLAVFFVNADTLERFGIPPDKYGSAFIRVTPYSADYAKTVASAIKDQLTDDNIHLGTVLYQDPNKHWGRSFFDGINLILQLLAVLTLLMSAVLVYNTLSNLITQQIDQIGILKAIGGRTLTIVTLYLSGTLVYGLLALLVAFPLASLVAFGMTQYFLELFNIDYTQFEVSQQASVYMLLSALVVPLLAGSVPVLQGAAITVRQAIASYGLGGDFGSSWLDRLIEQLGARLLPSQYATALGNMFRRKGRLLLTQWVLVIAGAAFLIVMSLNSSIELTLDNFFARDHFDTSLRFSESQRAGRVVPIAVQVSGVDKTELRLVQSASMLLAGQLVKDAGIGTTIVGIPPGSDFYTPLMVAGRWLAPGDQRAVVLTRDTAQKNYVQVGDRVTLNLGLLGTDEWQVIGLYEPVFSGAFAADTIYAPLDALFDVAQRHNQGTLLYVRTTDHSPAFVTQVTTNLKDAYEARKINIAASQTENDLRKTNEFQFSTVTSMLMGLSVIVAVVGGIALMGALSISVVERTKEIGVLRAIGARSFTILRIYLMEGILQGLLSVALAVPISFLSAGTVASLLGHAMFGAALDYAYNWPAVVIWLVIMLVISALATLLPARSATRVSVRSSLAYT